MWNILGYSPKHKLLPVEDRTLKCMHARESKEEELWIANFGETLFEYSTLQNTNSLIRQFPFLERENIYVVTLYGNDACVLSLNCYALTMQSILPYCHFLLFFEFIQSIIFSCSYDIFLIMYKS
jgi:hypothetical protein